MSQASILTNVIKAFDDNISSTFTSGTTPKLEVDLHCRCSAGTHYAFTPFICPPCTRWRQIFNYYTEDFDGKIQNDTNVSMITRNSLSKIYKSIDQSLDPTSCELYGSMVMRSLLPGYPQTKDAWMCGGRSTIVRDQCVSLEKALALRTPEYIASELLKQLDKLEKVDYVPSSLSYAKSWEVPSNISSIISYNQSTDTLCLPLPARIKYKRGGETYTISCDELDVGITIEHLRQYIETKNFINQK